MKCVAILVALCFLSTLCTAQPTALTVQETRNFHSLMTNLKEWFIERGKSIKNYWKKFVSGLKAIKDGILKRINLKFEKLKLVENELSKGVEKAVDAMKSSIQEYRQGTVAISKILIDLRENVDIAFNETINNVEKVIFNTSEQIQICVQQLSDEISTIPASATIKKPECTSAIFNQKIKEFVQISERLCKECSAKTHDQILTVYKDLSAFIDNIFDNFDGLTLKVLQCTINTNTCKTIVMGVVEEVKQHLQKLIISSEQLKSLPKDILQSVVCLESEEIAMTQRQYMISREIKKCKA